MEALAAYAKYQGCYDKWQEIGKRYSLHWTNGDESFHALQRFFNTELSLDTMLSRIREMVHKLPTIMGQTIKFGTLVGLRPTEILESIRLINDKEAFPGYYDPKQMTLQHFKFLDVFLRHTKKAFLSFVTPSMLENVINSNNKFHHITYNAIRHACLRAGIACDLRFCRKVHASWLHKSGINSETIDFLQGRTSPSVFCRHYLTPDASLRTRVLDALNELQKNLLTR
jgi:Archaeal phage integrase